MIIEWLLEFQQQRMAARAAVQMMLQREHHRRVKDLRDAAVRAGALDEKEEMPFTPVEASELRARVEELRHRQRLQREHARDEPAHPARNQAHDAADPSHERPLRAERGARSDGRSPEAADGRWQNSLAAHVAFVLLASVLLIVALALSAHGAAPEAWRTPSEASHYRTTPTYDETMHYVRRLADASPWIRVTTYGTSPQGRPLPLVIVSKRGAFTPARARATGEPIVLIQNGIHSGEIEGKDATLALLRDICITKTHAALIDHATLLILPIFSVDAHERRSRYNRINQNGPEEMGWRSTSQGLNLNRDYLKTETPEMRALIGNVFTKWWPHILVDNHTTDGADYQHDLTYSFNHGPDTPRAVEQWCVSAFEGRVIPRCGEMGHLTAPYLTFRGNGPQTGIDFTSSTPRFSTGYAAIQCRPGILVETHMLKPYETRVRATYDLMVALLEEIGAHPRALTQAVHDAEAEVVTRGRELGSVVLATRASDVSVPFAYRGRQAQMVQSDIAGGPIPHYSDAPWDTTIPLYRDAIATVTVQQPAGYIVPQEWTVARDWLAMHGVRFTPLARAWTDSVEMSRIVAWDVSPRGSEGHRPITARDVRLERQKRTFRAGDLWVPLDQPRGLVAVHICEARAPDGLLYWNAFNTILETKEYGEDYVVEPVARKMLAENPGLASEFAAKVASDSAFAADPSARLDWLYRRSPWADPDQNLLPIARALHAPPANALITRRRR